MGLLYFDSFEWVSVLAKCDRAIQFSRKMLVLLVVLDQPRASVAVQNGYEQDAKSPGDYRNIANNITFVEGPLMLW